MYSVVQSINQCITFLVHCSPGFACHKTVWRPPKCVYTLYFGLTSCEFYWV